MTLTSIIERKTNQAWRRDNHGCSWFSYDDLLSLQYGAIPVFVDVTIPTYNIDVSQLEAAVSEKTKAVMIAHTLEIRLI